MHVMDDIVELLNDDLKRRGVAADDAGALRALAKLVPFYGLCAYLSLRPALRRQDAPA